MLMSRTTNEFSLPYRPQGAVRFGTQSSEPPTPPQVAQPVPGEVPEALLQIADQFRQAARQTEGLPGADSAELSPFDQLVARLLNGDSAFGRQLVSSLNQVISGAKTKRSCALEAYGEPGKPRMGYRVKCGTLDKLFEKRTLASPSEITFDAFLEKKFGKDQRVVISMTGWTKPPVEPLLANSFYRRQMEMMPKSKWPQFAEKVYVNIIKKFLDDVIQDLKKELPEFNPITDLGIIYGVTPEGVDRGIQEYCMKNSIPVAGLTCYDWAEYIPDEAGLPDVYIAEDPASFGRFMADSSNKIVVTGGRSFAAAVKMDGQKASGAERRIPVDLFQSYAGVTVPPVVPGDDEITARVVNAAALAKAMGVDPWKTDVVQHAINGRQTDNPDAFATTHILKRELENLYQIREMAKG